MVRHTVWWAGVASRGHLTYGISWVRELLRREPGEVSLRMLPTRQFFGGDEITPSQVSALLDDARVDVAHWDGSSAPPGERLWMLSTGAVGIKPWLRLRTRHPSRRITVVVTDEGLGTYGNWRSRWEAMQRQGVGEPWRTVRTTAVELATGTLTNVRWPLHVRLAQRWGLNAPVADEFRRLAPAPAVARRAVFLSQPWPELGVLDVATYQNHVEEVAEACRRIGLDMVVLPHPGEAPGRHSRHAAHDAPAEPTLAEFNPVALGATVLVGASSTALLNLAAVHGIRALRVGTPELIALDEALAPRQASLLGQYASPCQPPAEFGRRLSQELGQ